MRLLKGHTQTIIKVILASDDTLIFSIAEDTDIKIWQTETGLCIKTLFVPYGFGNKECGLEIQLVVSNDCSVIFST